VQVPAEVAAIELTSLDVRRFLRVVCSWPGKPGKDAPRRRAEPHVTSPASPSYFARDIEVGALGLASVPDGKQSGSSASASGSGPELRLQREGLFRALLPEMMANPDTRARSVFCA
jgi:hypothetical protein